jgi:pimeloyl-ACP methyl ester carboxylesterase
MTTTFPLGAATLHYLEWGDPDAPAVLLLHGRTAPVQTWTDVAERLSDRYHVVALEQRGHGASSWSPEKAYNLGDFLGDLEAFADAVLPERFLLVGHSMGACTSLVYTARHPERVRALVLEDGGPPGPTVIDAVRDHHEQVPLVFADLATAREHVRAAQPWMDDVQLEREVAATLRVEEDGRVAWRSDLDGLLGDSHTARDELFLTGQWDAARELATDTLFLWASNPPLMDPDVAERLEASNPRIRRVTIDCGHSIHEERFEAFMSVVEPFLSEAAA